MVDLKSYQTVVVANGEAPVHPVAQQLLQQADERVCCDGAIRHLETLGLSPTAVVGDGDSIQHSDLQKYHSLFIQDASPDYNDLTKALNYCASRGRKRVAIVGGCGLRDDHTLGNIALLMKHSRDLQLVMVTNYGVFTPIRATTSFPSYPGEAVSVFSFCPDTKLTYQGLRYPVHQRSFLELWEGTLNESLGDSFCIQLQNEGEVLIYQAFQKENV